MFPRSDSYKRMVPSGDGPVKPTNAAGSAGFLSGVPGNDSTFP